MVSGCGLLYFNNVFTNDIPCYFGECYETLTKCSAQRIPPIIRTGINTAIKHLIHWVQTDYTEVFEGAAMCKLQLQRNVGQQLRDTQINLNVLMAPTYCEVALNTFIVQACLHISIRLELGFLDIDNDSLVQQHVSDLRGILQTCIHHTQMTYSRLVELRQNAVTKVFFDPISVDKDGVRRITARWQDRVTGERYRSVYQEQDAQFESGTVPDYLWDLAMKERSACVKEAMEHLSKEVLCDVDFAISTWMSMFENPLCVGPNVEQLNL